MTTGGATGSGSPVLDVRDLSKRFTLHLRGGLELVVLRRVSLRVAAGECVALTGASGRGKSTLMKCLFGSYGADSGEIRFGSVDGSVVDIARASAQQMLHLRRSDIAYVSQFLRALPRVSAIDIVAQRLWSARSPAVAEPAPADADLDEDADDAARSEARERARALLHRLNLPDSLHGLPPATFSGGEQQRVNIARGFIVPARLLLLDEPTASLDMANRSVVVDLIGEAKRNGAAVVGIFHDDEVRRAVADRCIELASAG